MIYEIYIYPKAEKEIEKIGKPFRDAVINKIQKLAENPYPVGSIKLTNVDLYRIRIGNYRVLYEVEKKDKRILITRIKHRKDIYR